jgi:hypothetical protein
MSLRTVTTGVGEAEEGTDGVLAALVTSLQAAEVTRTRRLVRSTCQRCPAWTGALPALRAISPVMPRARDHLPRP